MRITNLRSASRHCHRVAKCPLYSVARRCSAQVEAGLLCSHVDFSTQRLRIAILAAKSGGSRTEDRTSMIKKPAISKRPKLLRISEEIRQWSAMLEQDLKRWPSVTSRPMFGLIGFYRHGAIFAALPRTRALSSPNSLLVRFNPMPPSLLRRARKDLRINLEQKSPGTRWYSFELNSAGDLREALWWLNRAYEAAKKGPRHSRGRRSAA